MSESGFDLSMKSGDMQSKLSKFTDEIKRQHEKEEEASLSKFFSTKYFFLFFLKYCKILIQKYFFFSINFWFLL